MPSAFPYRALADVVLVLHFGVVLFVVGGLVLVLLGNLRGWHWVNSMSFRVAHVAAIGVVVVQAWLGQVCALTSLESWLREQGGATGYPGSFVQYWVGRLIYYDAPVWVFAVIYTAFALLVLFSWWRFPPNRSPRPAPR